MAALDFDGDGSISVSEMAAAMDAFIRSRRCAGRHPTLPLCKLACADVDEQVRCAGWHRLYTIGLLPPTLATLLHKRC